MLFNNFIKSYYGRMSTPPLPRSSSLNLSPTSEDATELMLLMLAMLTLSDSYFLPRKYAFSSSGLLPFVSGTKKMMKNVPARKRAR